MKWIMMEQVSLMHAQSNCSMMDYEYKQQQYCFVHSRFVLVYINVDLLS